MSILEVPDTQEVDAPEEGQVLVSPYVSWLHLALAYEPVSTPTEGRFRTLRNRHVCPEGVKVPRRTQTGVAGSDCWYSSLGFWSAILLRRGDEATALDLTELANRFRDRLERLDWSQTPTANPATELLLLAVQTDALARRFAGSLGLPLTTGTWTWTREGKAIIETGDGEEIQWPADSPYLAQSRLGDPLVILHEEAPSGAPLLLILPAVRVPAPHTDEPEVSTPSAVDEGGLRGPVAVTAGGREFFQRVASKAASGH